MANRIVLVSDDSNFFEFMKSKLELRKSDELFTFAFDSVPEKLHLLETAVLIVNSENVKEKTLDLLALFKETPVIIFAYNDDEIFRRKCFRSGAFDFMTILTSDADFRSRMIPALSLSALLVKNDRYRKILVDNQIITSENDVFLNYAYVLDKELQDVYNGTKKAVLLAISPSDKSKLLLNSAVIEAIILNNIRKNDILMNYAPNKYFLIMFDTSVDLAKKTWLKISTQMPGKIYAGFCSVTNQKREKLINEALNKLHEAIKNDRDIAGTDLNPLNSFDLARSSLSPYSNFKMFRQEFAKKIEQVISPVFYQVQQKFSNIFSGVTLEHGTGDGYGTFYIKGRNTSSCFRITSPGFSKINIDITYQKESSIVDSKRISIEPEELEQGLLGDLLEQFILEYKRGNDYDT